jgi:hypothetical protein
MAGDNLAKLCFVVGPIGDSDSDARIHADWLVGEFIEPVMAEFPGFKVVASGTIRLESPRKSKLKFRDGAP